MPEIRTETIAAANVKINDELWLTGDLYQTEGVTMKGVTGVNVVVTSKRLATKYVWLNDDAIRIPIATEVIVGRAYKTEAEVNAEVAAYRTEHLTTRFAQWNDDPKDAIAEYLESMKTKGVSWDTMSNLVEAQAAAKVQAQTLHAWNNTQQKRPEVTINEFATEYATYMGEELLKAYGFRATSKSTNTLSNVMEEAEREAKAKMREFLAGESFYY